MCRCAGSGRCVGVLIMDMCRVDDRGLCVGLSVEGHCVVFRVASRPMW